jgi:hypothetical protein
MTNTNHATIPGAPSPENIGVWFAVQDPNIYFLGGFQ